MEESSAGYCMISRSTLLSRNYLFIGYLMLRLHVLSCVVASYLAMPLQVYVNLCGREH